MIYFDGEKYIIVWHLNVGSITFETEQLESCKFKFSDKNRTSDDWLNDKGFEFINCL